MRWARYESEVGGRYAIVEPERLVDVDGTPFGEYSKTGKTIPLAEATLLPPCMPRNFFAVGYNYEAHTQEAATFLKKAPKKPSKPDVGSRFPSALVGHGATVNIPANSNGMVQFEGELVAIIGRKGKNIATKDVHKYILGYTIGNDISERIWQAEDATIWRSKCTDTFCPMGPWIETDVDLDSLETTIRLNGKTVSNFKTNNMIFGIERYLSDISQYIELESGDIIWMGAEAPSLDMRSGDVVEVEINQIGTLKNSISQARV